MQSFELSRLVSQREAGSNPYLEFLKVPDLSMGLYVLPAGGTDTQSPHTEDEVYYVVSGRAKILVAGKNRDVQAGSIVYVPKNVLKGQTNLGTRDAVLEVFFSLDKYVRKALRRWMHEVRTA